MATNVFKDDKLAYVYDTALSSTRAKSSTLKTQLNSYVQVLRALTINYSPEHKTLTPNGKSYFDGDPELKGFFNFRWTGKELQIFIKKRRV